MINGTLFAREMKAGIKLLVIFGAVITMYVVCIIWMYDPEMMKMLDGFAEAMPEIMAAVGMNGGAADLLGFMISYLYGFILLIFPMVFSILRGNRLIAGYVDRGSMAYLLAAPVKRRNVAVTQMTVLVSGIVILVVYITALELAAARWMFPGELVFRDIAAVNAGLLFLHLFIGSICFSASCVFSETGYSIAVGAGIPVLMYIFQMLANVGDRLENMKYFSVFTLFDPSGLAAGETNAVCGAVCLLAGAAVVFPAGITVFCRKDIHV